jgi:hypothetical protein
MLLLHIDLVLKERIHKNRNEAKSVFPSPTDSYSLWAFTITPCSLTNHIRILSILKIVNSIFFRFRQTNPICFCKFLKYPSLRCLQCILDNEEKPWNKSEIARRAVLHLLEVIREKPQEQDKKTVEEYIRDAVIDQKDTTSNPDPSGLNGEILFCCAQIFVKAPKWKKNSGTYYEKVN